MSDMKTIMESWDKFSKKSDKEILREGFREILIGLSILVGGAVYHQMSQDEEVSIVDIQNEYDAEKEKFSIEGEDETGRNDAYTSFKKIRNQIIDAYSGLSNEKDKNIFYDYLIANLKLYFDRFEEELQTTVEEPSSEIYDQQTGGEGPPPEGAAPPVEDPGLPPLQESNTYEFNENDLFKLIK